MVQPTEEDDQRPIRYAARQPILAADETVIGYKLLFRTGVVDHFSGRESNGESRTAIDMASLIGLNALCDNRLAFINCTRDILMEKSLAFLPPDNVVAEIGRSVVPDDTIQEICAAIKDAGYKIALDNFTVDDPREPLIDFADFLKIDIKESRWEEILRIPRIFGSHSLGLLAEKVETYEDFEYTRRAGFQFFQGYFFRKPETMRARGMTPNRTAYLRLLQAVSKPEMDWNEVEDLIKRDTTLYYRLLRYLNSAFFGLRNEVRSVSQALTFLGENELRRWCRLAGAFEMSKHRPSDLMLSALIRARFGELIAPSVAHGDADLFLVGLLSMMDAILEIPMSLVIDGLTLDADSAKLLLDNEGPLMPLYRLILAVERGAWREVMRRCDDLGIKEEDVAVCYSQGMEWAQSVAGDV